MKKLNFLAVAAVLFAAITLTGCDPTETPDEGDNTGTGTEIPNDKDGDGGGNNGDIRLVDKITWDDGQFFQLLYDSKNRVSKIEFDSEGENLEGEYMTITYSYGANAVTVTITNQYDTAAEFFFKLDSEGRIISSDENGDHWSYNDDGYLAKFTWSDNTQYDGTIIFSDEEDYFWSDGYLTKIESTETQHHVDESPAEDQITKTTTTYTYGDLANPAKVSLDMNADVILNDRSGFSVLMGFVGKSSAKLVSSRTYSSSANDRDYTTNYTWELDSKGYITKLTATSDLDGETYITTVTYKN